MRIPHRRGLFHPRPRAGAVPGRVFDCRALMKALGPERAVWAIKRGMLSPEIVLKGHELIPTLSV